MIWFGLYLKPSLRQRFLQEVIALPVVPRSPKETGQRPVARPLDWSASFSYPSWKGPWSRFRREARARERNRHYNGE
jgi:hypothetical protein